MVYYGEWIDDQVHTNRIYHSGAADRSTTYPARVVLGDPLRDAHSGWHLGSNASYYYRRSSDSASVSGTDWQPASDAAWDEATRAPLVPVTGVGGNFGWSAQSRNVSYSDVLDQSDVTWNLWAWAFRLMWGRSAWLGPSSEVWPEGAIDVEVEDSRYRQLLSVVARPYWPDTAGFGGFVKDMGTPVPEGWPNNVADLWGMGMLVSGPPDDPGVKLDHVGMQTFVDALPTDTNTASDLSFPAFAFAPTEPASAAPDFTLDFFPSFRVDVEFLGPRYRYVYATPPEPPKLLPHPPRRIFPRDDGLAGGAPRTYPPSKGLQSGNRTVGGYL